MTDLSLRDLSHKSAERQLEWDPTTQLGPLFFATELAGEVGEALNIVKKLEREAMGLRGTRASLDELGDELADVLIVLDRLAVVYGIDLSTAVRRKFNKTSDKYNLATRFD